MPDMESVNVTLGNSLMQRNSLITLILPSSHSQITLRLSLHALFVDIALVIAHILIQILRQLIPIITTTPSSPCISVLGSVNLRGVAYIRLPRLISGLRTNH